MQFHQGSRLKNLIEKSYLPVNKIAEMSGIARSSLYDLYEKQELLPSKIAPILDILNISQDRFYAAKLVKETSTLELNNDSFKQVVQLLEKHIEQQNEIIALLKDKK